MMAGIDPTTAPMFSARTYEISVAASAPPRCGASVAASATVNGTIWPPPLLLGMYV